MPPGSAKPLQPGRDVTPGLNRLPRPHVAQMMPISPVADALVFGQCLVRRCHALLKLDRALRGIDRAGELEIHAHLPSP